MKFDRPATPNPIDQLTIIGQPTPRIDGPLKTTGTAPYAYERHDVVPDQAYGFVIGAGIANGRIVSMDTREATAAAGVLAVVTTLDHAEPLPLGKMNYAHLFGGTEVRHYHQAIAVVVAKSFEQARAAAGLIRTDYKREPGAFDLAEAAKSAPLTKFDTGVGPALPSITRVGDFQAAHAAAPITLDETYRTPDESQAMMEPHATVAAWEGDRLTVWTSNQMIGWTRESLAKTLSIAPEAIRVDSPYVGGGFGGKLFIRADVVLAALGARAAGRPVKLALTRPLMINNTTHRPATIQRIRLGAGRDGRLAALAHEATSGNLPGGNPEAAILPTKLLYAAPHRELSLKMATLNLPEGNSMRAPGEAPGLMALEMAMDEMAERLGMDPVEFRVVNDTQVDPEKPDRRFSQRHLIECLRVGADRFSWSRRDPRPGNVREGRWLIGMGVAAGIRNAGFNTSAARVQLDGDGRLTVETDMTDIGTGSYTILAQTAAEMLGVSLDQVTVKLGDSNFPLSAGSGGQLGANSASSGLYAACCKLRERIAQRLGFNDPNLRFADGRVISGDGRSVPLRDAARASSITAEDTIEGGELAEKYQLSTFAAHFVEVAVDRYTGETRVRRMLAVCDAGRILNPLSARSQIIGGMTMGVGAALLEELAVDTRHGFFVNHDLAGYEVPVHADIPYQEVIFLDYLDDKSSPMRAKGVGELGICGSAAAVANAVYNATGIRVRDYPITLDKLLSRLPHIGETSSIGVS